MVRAQYHFRASPEGLRAWDVRRLITLSRGLPVHAVRIEQIPELDQDHWYAHEEFGPTCRSIVEHCRLIGDVDLSFPIILGEDGRVMDGMHRVCRALLEGVAELPAVRFERDPEPDYVGRAPDTLPYED